MSGGQRVDYSIHSKWHLNWKKLNVHSNDCGANCFSMLGYSNFYTSNELARRTPNGITLSEITNMLDDAYGDGHEWVSDVALYFKLPINQATIAYMQHIGEPMGHFFIIVRTDKPTFIAIDAQTYTQMPIADYYEQFDYPDNTLIMSSPNVLTQYNRVTMNIVNRYFPKPKSARKTRTKKIQWLVKSEV